MEISIIWRKAIPEFFNIEKLDLFYITRANKIGSYETVYLDLIRKFAEWMEDLYIEISLGLCICVT